MSNNYVARVAKIDKVEPIQGADRIQIAKVLGDTVVVSKDWEVGMVGVYFQADIQLSEELCRENNLFRHSHLNADQTKQGFFDDNRKVRAQPFRKVRSEGFFAGLDIVEFTGYDTSKLKIGDTFEKLNGKDVCCKFISEKTRQKLGNVQKKKTKTVQTPMFNKHVDTDQFKYYAERIPAGALLSFHAKVHGTSVRMSYSKVVRKLPKWKEVVNKVVKIFDNTSWEYLVGTRNVTLFEDQYDKEGFHGNEQYRFDALEMVKPYLTKGMTIYGELAGYANNKPIMGVHNSKILKDKKFTKKYGEDIIYKYGCTEETTRFHIYRISITNEDGVEIDFTAKQVEEWCESRNLPCHLNVHEPFIYNGNVEALKELVEELTERPDVLTEDYIDPSHPSEGIIVRVDNGTLVPKFYKSKSYVFRVLEGIFKEDNIDVEDAS